MDTTGINAPDRILSRIFDDLLGILDQLRRDNFFRLHYSLHEVAICDRLFPAPSCGNFSLGGIFKFIYPFLDLRLQ